MNTRWLWVALLSACGGSSGGTVSITIDQAGTPRMGVSVYFQNEDSTLVTVATTDARGEAHAELDDGGFVTAVAPFDANELFGDNLFTYAGVAGGDHLVIHEPAQSSQITMMISVPADPGADHYQIGTTCGSSQLTGAGSPVVGEVVFEGCAAGGPADLVVESADAGDQPLHAIVARDVQIGEGGMITVTGAYQPLVDVPLSFTNVPGDVDTVFPSYAVTTDKGTLVEAKTNADVNGGAATATVTVPQGAFGFVEHDHFDVRGTSDLQREAYTWGPAAGQPIAHDCADAALPGFAAPPVVNADTHTVTWQSTPGTAAADLTFAWVVSSRQVDATTEKRWSWYVVGPYRDGELRLPALPGSAAVFNMMASDKNGLPVVEHLTSDGGYAAARAVVFAYGPFAPLTLGDHGQSFVVDYDQVF